MDNYSKTKIYYQVRKTTIEMLGDRHFVVSDEDRNLPYQDFASRFEENQINIIANHSSDENKVAFVSYILETKTFSKKDLQNLN